jgi:hypothetical protein
MQQTVAESRVENRGGESLTVENVKVCVFKVFNLQFARHSLLSFRFLYQRLYGKSFFFQQKPFFSFSSVSLILLVK